MNTGANRSLADITEGPPHRGGHELWPASEHAIAVLPFQNFGTVTDSDLLADGLTYESPAFWQGSRGWPSGQRRLRSLQR